MTEKEAITIIDNLHLIGCGRNQHENDLKINVALDMAIESLQKDIERHEMVIRASEIHLGLVRCKDCIHSDPTSGYVEDVVYCKWLHTSCIKNGYCHRGERRTNTCKGI